MFRAGPEAGSLSHHALPPEKKNIEDALFGVQAAGIDNGVMWRNEARTLLARFCLANRAQTTSSQPGVNALYGHKTLHSTTTTTRNNAGQR